MSITFRFLSGLSSSLLLISLRLLIYDTDPTQAVFSVYRDLDRHTSAPGIYTSGIGNLQSSPLTPYYLLPCSLLPAALLPSLRLRSG
jgi:hypothetical protein